MLQELKELNNLTPLMVIGLLSYIVYLLIRNRKNMNNITTNHLSGLPEMYETLKRIEENQRQEIQLLNDLRIDNTFIKTKINGKI